MTGVDRGAEGRLSAEPDGLRPSRRGSAHDDPLVRAGRTVRGGRLEASSVAPPLAPPHATHRHR